MFVQGVVLTEFLVLGIAAGENFLIFFRSFVVVGFSADHVPDLVASAVRKDYPTVHLADQVAIIHVEQAWVNQSLFIEPFFQGVDYVSGHKPDLCLLHGLIIEVPVVFDEFVEVFFMVFQWAMHHFRGFVEDFPYLFPFLDGFFVHAIPVFVWEVFLKPFYSSVHTVVLFNMH